MSTPIERAAEAIAAADYAGTPERALAYARAALEAAIDEEDLARLIAGESGMEWDYSPDDFDDMYLREARAIKAHLLGGAE